ncbi:MAG: CRTAC1 family protein [Bryobacterales bacterium]|jgi:hypothetical protein|nr:CRTAC1 family protein [Bryobacterales bacterium]
MSILRFALPMLLALTLSAQVTFIDVTRQAGITWRHNAGKAGKKWLPETMGPGCAFLDLNNDGYPDIVLVNSRSWTPGKAKSLSALYLNNGNGTFRDATVGSGLDVERYGLGVTAGDFDNDGLPDLYVTALEGDRLLRNLGNGKFQDVTTQAGIANKGFGSSAAFFDFDRDGKLDLFVANYVQWSATNDLFCSLDGAAKSYCTPESYKGRSPVLYRNLGGGKFQDVTKSAGVYDESSKGLGVTVFDYDNDGWQDLFVANDTQPNKLYHNLRNGRFEDVGLTAGVAFDESGVARGAMGVDAADYSRSGRQHLVVGNFSNQMLSLFHNEGKGLFVDDAARAGVGRPSLLTLTFGAFFLDYDNDGFLDIFTANGHIDEEITRVQPKVTYAQAPQMYRNLGGKRFQDVSATLGQDFQKALVARGAAYADYDLDGDPDILIANNNGAPVLLRNDGGNRGKWLRVRTVGSGANRDGIGAVLKLTTTSGTQTQTVRSGSSYCSQSEFPVTFGLGADPKASQLEITWPGGERQVIPNPPIGKAITVVQGKGIQ